MKFEWIAFCDLITKVTMIVCATYAACYFEKWGLLFFCLVATLFGHSFERTYKDGKEKSDDGNASDV